MLSMLIPSLAGVLVYRDVARRSLLTEQFYTVRDLGLVLGQAAQSVDQLLSDDSVSNQDLLENIRRDLRAYAQLLDQLPPMLRERGIQDFGIAGEMREALLFDQWQ
ncbi:hypothetical protein [Congregibacter sp.]|uniref:hypothetical protein n=1 Tax=Congregibacter sp. TaxID=2744308 RepID=UPI003F6B3F46